MTRRLLPCLCLLLLALPAAAGADEQGQLQAFLAPQQALQAAVQSHRRASDRRLLRVARHIKRCDALQDRGPRDPQMKPGASLGAMLLMLGPVASEMWKAAYQPVRPQLQQMGEQYAALQTGDEALDLQAQLISRRVKLVQELPHINLCRVATRWRADHYRSDRAPKELLNFFAHNPDREQQQMDRLDTARAEERLRDLGLSSEAAERAAAMPFDPHIYQRTLRMIEKASPR